MARDYNYATLAQIRKHEPLMRKLGVARVARQPGGFLPMYKRVKGNPNRIPEAMKQQRHAFISRSLSQYKENSTLRRRLALLAWAYSA